MSRSTSKKGYNSLSRFKQVSLGVDWSPSKKRFFTGLGVLLVMGGIALLVLYFLGLLSPSSHSPSLTTPSYTTYSVNMVPPALGTRVWTVNSVGSYAVGVYVTIRCTSALVQPTYISALVVDVNASAKTITTSAIAIAGDTNTASTPWIFYPASPPTTSSTGGHPVTSSSSSSSSVLTSTVPDLVYSFESPSLPDSYLYYAGSDVTFVPLGGIAGDGSVWNPPDPIAPPSGSQFAFLQVQIIATPGIMTLQPTTTTIGACIQVTFWMGVRLNSGGPVTTLRLAVTANGVPLYQSPSDIDGSAGGFAHFQPSTMYKSTSTSLTVVFNASTSIDQERALLFDDIHVITYDASACT